MFIVDKNTNVEYKGYATLHGRVANQIGEFNLSRRIDYWKNRIPYLIK